jgi:hypothetical protein
MRAAPPSGGFDDRVAVFGCGRGRSYPTGLYPMSALRVPVHGPKSKSFPKVPVEPLPEDWRADLASNAEFVATEKACFHDDNALQELGYEIVAKRKRPGGTTGQLFDLWLTR